MNENETEPQVVEPAADAVPETTEQTQAATEKETETESYDWVQPKFKDTAGKPDFKKLAESYRNLEKKMNQKPNVPPVSIDAYEFDTGDLGVDEEQATKFKEQVLAKGFTTDQYAFMMEQYKASIEQLTWSQQRSKEALSQEWGNDFDRMAVAAKAGFEEFAPSSADINDPIWNHPEVMKLLARMGSELGEDSLARKSSVPVAQQMTPAEAEAIMRSPEYKNGNREAHAKITAWFNAGNKL